MTPRHLFAFGSSLGLLAAFAACGGNSADSSGTNAAQGAGGSQAKVSNLPCDIDKLVKARCQECHGQTPAFGAPHSMINTEDFKRMTLDGATTIGQRAIARRAETAKPMPQPPNPLATTAEQAAFAAWVGAGMPSGDPTCGAGGSNGTGGAAGSGTAGSGNAGSGTGVQCAPGEEVVDVVPSSPWEMPASVGDQYVCFAVDIPPGGDDTHITKIYPSVDNSTILHHILLYSGDKSYGAGPPKACASTPPVNWKLYYAWGPGTPPAELPPEAGFRLSGSKGGHFMVQTHYSNLQHMAGQKDATGMKMCRGPLRQYDADVMAFGSTDFNLPAHTKKDVDCSTKASIVPGGPDFKVFQLWPHMHLLGRHMKVEVKHADGTTDVIHDKDYDFNNQITYPADFSLIKKSDSVRTVCSFDNMTNGSVSFGEETEKEMCFSFFSYYPAGTAATWSWIAPAGLAQCASK